jgi:hypothetical protein
MKISILRTRQNEVDVQWYLRGTFFGMKMQF